MSTHCPKCHTDNTPGSKFCSSCGLLLDSSDKIPVSQTKTSETPVEELTTGSTFADRYQIIEELGKGGMGRVYKALDKEINEKIAIKLIKPEIASDKKTIERFRNELTTARRIVQKNVCRMYDLNKDKGSYFITMEYVSGGDLKRLIRRVGQLPSGKVISIAKQICDGLNEAHSMGIVHRDLKPNNIMIDDNGNARIMDFGIARTVKGKGITGSGVMIGTPEYMSPEQVEAKDIDQRSDIYSLGVILYEMTTGRLPFEGDTPLAIAMKHKGETPRDPKEFNAQIPEDLSQVILKCLEKNSDNRYLSADELKSELINIEKGLPTTDRDVPRKKPLTSREFTVQFNMKKLLIPAFAVMVVIAVVLVLWPPWKQQESTPIFSDKPSLAIMYFQNKTGEKSLDVWRDGIPGMLIADLSQSKHIRVLSDDQIYGILKKLGLLEAKNYSPEELKEVAALGNSTHILKGSLSKAGDSFRITTTLQETNTMGIVDSEIVDGQGEESLLKIVDELTTRIKENFKISAEELDDYIDRQIGQFTTYSPEALKYYIRARRYHMEYENRKAIENYKKAILIDPEFATAYRGMATAYSNLGQWSERLKYLRKAMELKDRLSEREFYRVQSNLYSQTEKTYEKAIEVNEKLVELYPDFGSGYNSLGVIYWFLGEWDKAVEYFNIPIQNKWPDQYPYGNIQQVYREMGLHEKAIEVAKEYFKNFGEFAAFHRYLAETYLFQGKYDLALVEINTALSISPAQYWNFYRKGDIYVYKDDLERAEKEYLKLLDYDDPFTKAAGKRKYAGLYLIQGKFKESKEKLKEGLKLMSEIGERENIRDFQLFLSYIDFKMGNYDFVLEEINKVWESAVEDEDLVFQRLLLHEKGLLDLEMKSIGEAQRTADKLKQIIEDGLNKRIIWLHHHLLGKIGLKKGNYSKAIDLFKEALPLLAADGSFNIILAESLATAYYRAEDLDRARTEYERIISLNLGRLNYGDIYAKSFYMLGKIHEQQGNTAKAIEHYEKFLSLWKDADPGIAEVDETKMRLAELK